MSAPQKIVMACLLAAGLFLTPGCVHQNYVVRLTNGSRIVTASKPRLKGNSYVFKDALGREQSISQGRVMEIAPQSMATDERQKFKPSVK